MRSSTSSFDPQAVFASSGRRWLLGWAGGLLIALIALGAVEAYWRAQGYRPTLLDSTMLWSAQRGRVDPAGPRALVLLGASRIEFGIDMRALQRLLPHYTPVMLAVNAHYPLATLRDLAQDEHFSGTVLCDVDSLGLLREYTEMQREYVQYFHRQWTPSWHLHRALLNRWQAHAVIADPAFGAVNALRRWIDGAATPFHNYVTFHADRSGDLDFSLTDAAAIKRHFADSLAANLAALPRRSSEEWLADLAPVREWVQEIQAHGGRVIFMASPTSGAEQSSLRQALPRAAYWDRFASAMPYAFDAADEPTLAAFTLPDDSHLDYHDKPAYTQALVDVLLARGWLQR